VKTNKLFISGKHAAREALTFVPHAVTRVFVSRDFKDQEIAKLIAEAKIEKSPLSEGEARADLKGNQSSQGIVVQVSLSQLTVPLEQYLERAEVSPQTMLVLLDGVQDPHNMGAIIRSAAAFGASAVLLPGAKQSPVTAAVIKSSAGMAFQLPLVSVVSSAMALQALKKKGFKAYALAAGKQDIAHAEFKSPSIFVVGNEGVGLEKSVRALCDETLSIPMHVDAESLNVAASAAVALYEWSQKHRDALE